MFIIKQKKRYSILIWGSFILKFLVVVDDAGLSVTVKQNKTLFDDKHKKGYELNISLSIVSILFRSLTWSF